MKTNYFKIVFVLLFSAFYFTQNSVYSQSIEIVDASNLQPLVGVSIYNQDQKSVVTNPRGKANLDIFAETDTLYFRYYGYDNKKIAKADVTETILLSEKIFETQQVVVSANKWEQDKKEIPNEIVKISQKEIAFNNPQTSADLLGQTGQVYIQKSQMGGGSPMFRGFNANSVLIVVDGVRMNNAIYRSGNLQNIISLDASAMEEVEVIFGPGSVMYGSDALGGVMDFHTKKARFATDKNLLVGGSGFVRYSSANQEKTGNLTLNIAGKRLASLTTFTFTDYDDLRVGGVRPDGEAYQDWGKRNQYVERMDGKDTILTNSNPLIQKQSGYSQWNLLQKFTYQISDDLQAEYAFHYTSSSDIPRYDRLVQKRDGELRYAEWYYGRQFWMMNYGKLTWFAKKKAFDAMRVIISNQQVEESRHNRTRGNDWRSDRTENVSMSSFNIDFDKDLRKDQKHQIFYGIDFNYNDVQSKAVETNIVSNEERPLDTRYPDGGSTMAMAAAYFNYKWNISDKMTATAGARYTQIWTNAKFDNKEFFDFPFDEAKVNTGALNGSLGLTFRPRDSWQFNANLSSGFRAPNVDDLGKVFESVPGSVVVPNPNLAPAYTYNAEIGVSKTFAERVRLSVTGYYTILNDAMVLRNSTFNGQDSIIYDGVMSKVISYQNTDVGYIYGVSSQIEAAITDKFKIKSTFNYVYGFDDKAEIRLPDTPPAFGLVSLKYQNKRFKVEGFVNYQLKSVDFDEMSPEDQGDAILYPENFIPSWWTLNLRSSYQINKTFSANLTAENILDKYYLSYGSGIGGTGRNFVVALRANF
ncbi:outer membrane receptor protein [Bernardetia litoralis DSM 6794]|uniref:Outer membrane receptor protein n=1 Tax=Bernardetia litoralis (strain ATCC 23117 / DSM 6794 / NBRC 15988 / NCIMB 1366 / Fx l1 / Sio-4) TaxID=880071 RepID=I4AQR8_BERLS|nr:TonB-dependent receptor [Bernardetia litoralis]AFM06303.1 outer membrane receptor protein [Bernardetia litoralis DSM 6794]